MISISTMSADRRVAFHRARGAREVANAIAVRGDEVPGDVAKKLMEHHADGFNSLINEAMHPASALSADELAEEVNARFAKLPNPPTTTQAVALAKANIRKDISASTEAGAQAQKEYAEEAVQVHIGALEQLDARIRPDAAGSQLRRANSLNVLLAKMNNGTATDADYKFFHNPASTSLERPDRSPFDLGYKIIGRNRAYMPPVEHSRVESVLRSFEPEEWVGNALENYATLSAHERHAALQMFRDGDHPRVFTESDESAINRAIRDAAAEMRSAPNNNDSDHRIAARPGSAAAHHTQQNIASHAPELSPMAPPSVSSTHRAGDLVIRHFTVGGHRGTHINVYDAAHPSHIPGIYGVDASLISPSRIRTISSVRAHDDGLISVRENSGSFAVMTQGEFRERYGRPHASLGYDAPIQSSAAAPSAPQTRVTQSMRSPNFSPLSSAFRDIPDDENIGYGVAPRPSTDASRTYTQHGMVFVVESSGNLSSRSIASYRNEHPRHFFRGAADVSAIRPSLQSGVRSVHFHDQGLVSVLLRRSSNDFRVMTRREFDHEFGN